MWVLHPLTPSKALAYGTGACVMCNLSVDTGDCCCGATVCQPYRLTQHVVLQRIQIYAFHTAVAPVAAQYPMIKVINIHKSALHAHHVCWQTASIPGVLGFAHRLV